MLEETIVLLRRDLPMPQALGERIEARRRNGRLLNRVIVSQRQPAMPFERRLELVVLRDMIVGRASPHGQLRRAPAALLGLLLRTRRRQLREIGLDGVEAVVHPAERRLVDDIGRDDEVLGVLELMLHERRDGVVLDEHLRQKSASRQNLSIPKAFPKSFPSLRP